jgi:hypothetical protein
VCANVWCSLNANPILIMRACTKLTKLSHQVQTQFW